MNIFFIIALILGAFALSFFIFSMGLYSMCSDFFTIFITITTVLIAATLIFLQLGLFQYIDDLPVIIQNALIVIV